jgi:hypothetical protein
MGLFFLKLMAVLFGSIPFILVGLFYLLGGIDTGARTPGAARLVGVPFLVAGIFWALRNPLLLQVKPGLGSLIFFYLLPGGVTAWFFVWVVFSTKAPALFLLGLLGLLVLAGIGCAAAYHVKSWKKADEEFHYIQSC